MVPNCIINVHEKVWNSYILIFIFRKRHNGRPMHTYIYNIIIYSCDWLIYISFITGVGHELVNWICGFFVLSASVRTSWKQSRSATNSLWVRWSLVDERTPKARSFEDTELAVYIRKDVCWRPCLSPSWSGTTGIQVLPSSTPKGHFCRYYTGSAEIASMRLLHCKCVLWGWYSCFTSLHFLTLPLHWQLHAKWISL